MDELDPGTSAGDTCLICLRKNSKLPNEVVSSCKVCLERVHRSCYGLTCSSESKFRCDSCDGDSRSETNKSCKFCRKSGEYGGLKYDEPDWFHPICKVISCQPKEEQTPLKQCKLCNQQKGKRFKCKFETCQQIYHIRCALIAMYQIIIRKDDGDSGDGIYEIWCEKHRDKADQKGVIASSLPLRKGRGKYIESINRKPKKKDGNDNRNTYFEMEAVVR